SEQRDRLSGWGFLGMLSGVDGGGSQSSKENDNLRDWGFPGVPNGTASDVQFANFFLDDPASTPH
ncbi:MAG: hypothetical protein ABEH81_04450, partial [Halopenitus sp.]